MISSLEITAQTMPAKKLVVLLHGLGSDGNDLLGLAPFFQNSFPHYHFYAPNGVEKCDMSPFGYQWFSLKNRDPDAMRQDMERTAQQILDIIEDKLNELKLTYEDLILIGFSQGTMMSLYLAFAYEFSVAAVVGFSGAFLPPELIHNKQTPVCLIHGRDDDVVSFSSMEDAKERLNKAGVMSVETHPITNLTHTIDLSGINYAKEFLNKYMR